MYIFDIAKDSIEDKTSKLTGLLSTHQAKS